MGIFKFLKKPFQIFKNLSFKKKLIVIVVVIAVIFFAWNRIGKGEDSKYVMGEVTRAVIIQTVSEIGNVDSGANISVTSPSTGKIEEVLIANGDKVTEGQMLAKIKSTATQQKKQAAYSDYLTSVSTLNAAKVNLNVYRSAMYGKWDTYRSIATNGTYGSEDGDVNETNREAAEFQIAKDDWLAAESKYKNQNEAVAQAQASVNSTRILYEATQDADMKATSDGSVANLAVTQGGSVEAGDSVLIIASSSQNPIIKVSINEVDIGKVKKGQDAEIEVDAINDKVFKGIVDRVDSVGTNIQGVITYNIFILLTESDSMIRSEMTANVNILTETRKNVMSVPNGAIKPYQGGRAVQILKGSEPTYIPVRIGIRGDARTEITEGLVDGQKIIVGATNDLIKRSGAFGL
jgi:HlyD family secretion protein